MLRTLLILLLLLLPLGVGDAFQVEHGEEIFNCDSWTLTGEGNVIKKLVCAEAQKIEAVFSAQTVANTRTVNFTDLSTGEPTEWLWEFGDGNMSALQNCSHTYAQNGRYQIVLTIKKGQSTDQASWVVDVRGQDVVVTDLVDHFNWQTIVDNQTPPEVGWVWRALEESNVSWTDIDIRQENVHKLPGILRLHVPANSVMQGNYWYTDQNYHYGKFCASVKMPKATPTGGQIGAVPSIWIDAKHAPDGTRIQGDNEIDIEYVLNENKLYFTVHGIGDYKEWYAITFPHAESGINDPSEGFNTYCLAWYPNRVEFFVNDFGPDQDSSMRIVSGTATPKHPAKLILWNTSVMDGWGGSRTDNNPINMDIEWVSWTEIDNNQPPPITGVPNILPLGDSITSADGRGSNTWNSYRPALWKMLKNAGYTVDFIGSETNHGPTESEEAGGHNTDSYDLNHEGHGGYRVDELLSCTRSFCLTREDGLPSYTPDIVLLHIGTNDFAQGQDADSTITEVKAVLEALRADNPKVIVFLGQIIPIGCGANTVLKDYNAKLAVLASSMTTTESPIIIVDHFSSYDCRTDFEPDYTHPNPSGENKMAKNWYDALIKVLPTP